MINSTNNIQRDKGKTAEAGYCNKLGAVVSDGGCKPEVLSGIAQATASLAKLKPIWKDNKISWIKGEAHALHCHFHISVCL